jgi:hypothetical protein
MTTISIERLVSSYNNETMITDSTYDDIKDIFCPDEQKFKECYDSLKQNYIVNGDVEQILPSSIRKNVNKTYEDLIRDEKNANEKLKLQTEFITEYIKQNLFLNPLFGNNYRKVAGERKNTLFLFPTFNTSSKGIEKLNASIDKYYRWIFKLNDFERFYLNNKSKIPEKGERVEIAPPYKELITLPNPVDGLPCNSFAFLPVFSDGNTETNDEFKQRMKNAFEIIADGIKKEAKFAEGQIVLSGGPKIPFTNICFMVDNDKNLFTDYYANTTLSKEKTTILNDILKEFIQRKSIDAQNLRLPDVSSDPMKKLNKDYVSKELASIARKIELSVSNSIYSDKLSKLDLLIDKINETYKKTVDKAYAKLATAQSNISFMRLYYRVNNIDKIEDNVIRTGNDFLYLLKGVVLNPEDKDPDCNTIYVCKMYEVPGRANRYRAEIHINETKDLRNNDNRKICVGDDSKTDEAEIEESKGDDQSKYYQTMIEVRKVFGTYKFKKDDNSTGLSFPGTLTFFRDLHTNERYKWFKHNDLDGSLSQEMQIKFYQNILFDKKSLIEYLKSKKTYDEKNLRLAYEFLKINEDVKLLMEYSDFIYNNPTFNKTHINEPNLLLKSLPFNQNLFLEKIKDSILDILFQPNQIIYIGGAKRSTTEKTDTTKNYKVIGFTRYKTDVGSVIKKNMKGKSTINDKTSDKDIKSIFPLTYSHMMNISHGDEAEVRYCPHRKINKCEIIRDTLKEFEERVIAVVDITRDVHDASELKEKAKCKRLRKSIKLRMKKLIEPVRFDKVVLGKIIGGKKTKKRRRRN